MAVRASADQAPVAALGGAASAIASARRAALADRYAAGSLDVDFNVNALGATGGNAPQH